MQYVVAMLLSYLLGSVAFSYVIVKWIKGTDVRKHGSGNAGATNTLRVLGWGPALVVLALDIGKGVLAVWIGKWMADGADWLPIACGAMVIVGHNWPVFLRFRGGKGVATTLGASATLLLWPTLILVAIAVAVIAWTRYVSVGSLLGTAVFPLVVWWLDGSVELITFGVFVAAMTWFKHRTNLVKLVNGTENKLGKKA